jgi:hypothetical protein
MWNAQVSAPMKNPTERTPSVVSVASAIGPWKRWAVLYSPTARGWICLGARPLPAPGTVEEREVGGESERDDLSIPDHGEEEREGRH